MYLPAVLQAAGLVPSAGQARRDIDGGGVKLDGEAIAPKTYNVDPAASNPARSCRSASASSPCLA